MGTQFNVLLSHNRYDKPQVVQTAQPLVDEAKVHPALRPAEFFQGRDANSNGRRDITWFRDSGAEAERGYLDSAANHFLAYHLDGTELGDSVASLYVAYNGWSGDVAAAPRQHQRPALVPRCRHGPVDGGPGQFRGPSGRGMTTRCTNSTRGPS